MNRGIEIGDVGTIEEPLTGDTVHVEVIGIESENGEQRLKVRPIFGVPGLRFQPSAIGCPLEAFTPKEAT